MSSASENAYQAAYQAHYKTKNFETAFRLYLSVIKDYPDSNEAKYAKQQITNLQKVIDCETLDLDTELLQIKDEIDAKETKQILQEENVKAAQQRYEEEEKAKKLLLKQLRETMLLSTCPSIDGFRVTKQLGLVFGECVYKTGFLKSLSASVDNLFDILSFGDKELSGTSRILSSAREYAVNKMVEDAAERGANAIIGVDSESSIGGDIMHVTVYGTAVRIEPIEQ